MRRSPGNRHQMKLLNNFLPLGYAAIYAEALAVAAKAGISTATFDSVIRGGRMDCGFYQTFTGYALEGNCEAHRFTLSNAYKDLWRAWPTPPLSPPRWRVLQRTALPGRSRRAARGRRTMCRT
ncbi:MAG: NAD(P)-dependent oxidoreductase [Tabrizicola sp.]|nr:NAD(P)-dependent oxidoreductase [Tabrizicola sp.]